MRNSQKTDEKPIFRICFENHFFLPQKTPIVNMVVELLFQTQCTTLNQTDEHYCQKHSYDSLSTQSRKSQVIQHHDTLSSKKERRRGQGKYLG
mmetsp:Transcript_8365/g.20566  ORF Transcript_8365/g.20566 Transcript_8365/m.20566 type:complete len:93 (+) Transcript_8365:27-305(+)